MGYTIDENPLRELQDQLRQRVSQEDGPKVTVITEMTADDEDVPDYVREYAKKVAETAEQASANPPVHEEYHVTDLVEIAIPHHFLLNLIFAAQTTANEIVDQIKATASVVRAMPEGMELPPQFAELLNSSAQRYLDYVHLGASLNSIRLAAKPLDLPDPHGNLEAGQGVELSDKDMSDLEKLLSDGLNDQ